MEGKEEEGRARGGRGKEGEVKGGLLQTCFGLSHDYVAELTDIS